MILDGVVRPDIDFNLAAGHTLSYALRNVFHSCAQDRRCAQAYPDLEQKFLAIVDQLHQKPVALTLTTPLSKQAVVTQLDGNAFAAALISPLARPYSGNTARGTSIPKYIQTASKGDFGWLVDMLSSDLQTSDASAKGMYETVLCARANSVKATPDEKVVYSWVEWPSKAVRDEGWKKLMADPRMQNHAMPFDGKRMIYGGFAPIVDA